MNNKKSSLSLGAMKNSMCTSKMNHGSAAADALANLLRLGFFRYPAANDDDRSAHVNGLMEDTVASSRVVRFVARYVLGRSKYLRPWNCLVRHVEG